MTPAVFSIATFHRPPATTISYDSNSSSPEKEYTSRNRLGIPPRRGVEKPEGPSALQPTTEYRLQQSSLIQQILHESGNHVPLYFHQPRSFFLIPPRFCKLRQNLEINTLVGVRGYDRDQSIMHSHGVAIHRKLKYQYLQCYYFRQDGIASGY